MKTIKNIKLDKDMYKVSGKSFTAVLEELDPTDEYEGTGLDKLDAFERQLKRFDIKVKGNSSSQVQKFFENIDSSVLFPEYISRAVRSGLESADILPQIVATTSIVDSFDYRTIASTPLEEDKSLGVIAEGAALPVTSVKTKDNLIRLYKRGRMLVSSYEAIRFQKLDLFTVTLKQIGAQIAKMHLTDAINVIKNGDGNNNAAEIFSVGTAPIGGTAGSVGYNDLIDFWAQFDPHEMNTLIVSPDVMKMLLKLDEFKSPVAGLNFIGTGSIGTPLGANIIKTNALDAGTIIGLDKNYALEMVKMGDVSIEYDKLIDRQLQKAAITCTTGFAKIYDEASKILNV